MYKILGQGNPAVNTDTIIYTVPAGYTANIKSIYVTDFKQTMTNAQSNEKQYKIHIIKQGELPERGNVLSYYPNRRNIDLPDVYNDITLNEGDSVLIFTKNEKISIQIFGEELRYDSDDIVNVLQQIKTSLDNIEQAIITHP